MNYTNIYNNLIQRGKDRVVALSFPEVHHIVPRCMQGTDCATNLVTLTSEEHLLAHLLLARIYPTNGSITLALFKMLQSSWSTPGRASFNKKYARWRRDVVTDLKELKWWNNGSRHVRSKECPDDGYELGMLNDAWNKGIPMSAEQRAIQSAKLKGRAQPVKTLEAKAKSGHKGTDWWTNGTRNKRSVESPGTDWRLGFTAKKVGSKGMSWWNNGHTNTMAANPPNETWIKGRLTT